MNIQSTRGSGAVVNQFEELAQQGFTLYIVLHWSANNNVDYNIIESVDSISRDVPDTPIYIIHYKKRNNSE